MGTIADPVAAVRSATAARIAERTLRRSVSYAAGQVGTANRAG